MAARARAPHPANASRQSGATTKIAEEPINQDHPVPAGHGGGEPADRAPTRPLMAGRRSRPGVDEIIVTEIVRGGEHHR